jgi:hypothetical protein
MIVAVKPIHLNTKTGALQLTAQSGSASTQFDVLDYNFGVRTNDTTALVAIPQVTYDGPGAPTLTTTYYQRSLASYDWTSLPAQGFYGSRAVWKEQLAHGFTAGQDATGVSNLNQQVDEIGIFVSGALVGLGGAALLTALQEYLHFYEKPRPHPIPDQSGDGSDGSTNSSHLPPTADD